MGLEMQEEVGIQELVQGYILVRYYSRYINERGKEARSQSVLRKYTSRMMCVCVKTIENESAARIVGKHASCVAR